MVRSLQRIGVYFADRSNLLETIVVDDGSQDGTAWIVQSLTEVHPWIRMLRSPTNTRKRLGSAGRGTVRTGSEDRLLRCGPFGSDRRARPAHCPSGHGVRHCRRVTGPQIA